MKTRRTALAAVLAAFLAPLALSQEIGTDFRISIMGDDSETDVNVRASFDGQTPSIAYNSINDEFLVVWFGDDGTDGENEIWGQRLNASTGAKVGSQFRISDMGPDGNASFGGTNPAVAYNSLNNEYLVVWPGDDDTGDLVDQEFEIYGQRIDAATGTETGTNDFRISDMGSTDGDTAFGAANPDVAYDSVNNEYLVVWNGDDDTGSQIENEFEVFGQRLNAANGAEVGTNDFRISDVGGTDGDSSFGGFLPRVAFNATSQEYLVVWQADDGGVDNANEIYGQRLTAGSGAEAGTNDFRISDMGASAVSTFVASSADVAWNAAVNEYLVIWNGDDDTGTLVDGEFEIFGQRIDGTTGAEVGTNDFRISDMGPDGDTSYGAFNAEVVANPNDAEYLVVWQADDSSPLVDGENEVFAQRIDATTGEELGDNDLRVSDMGPDGDANYDGNVPNAGYGSGQGSYLVVWSGEDNTAPLVDGENEVHGQFLEAPDIVWVDFDFTGGAENGSFANPFDTLAEGVAAVDPGGVITIVESSSSETPTITKSMTITSIGSSIVGQN